MPAEHDRASVEHHRCSPLAQPRYDDGVLQFSVETATDSLTDLELQIVPISQEASSSTTPAHPATQRSTSARWTRRRLMTERDEIVDHIVDAASRRVCWSIHKPVRGWYMHLRSSQMPPGVSLPLQPPSSSSSQDEQEPGSTPLTLTLHTRIRQTALSHVNPFIALPHGQSKLPPLPTAQPHEFTTVNLDAAHTYPPVPAAAAAAASTVSINADDEVVARTTGIDSAQAQQKTHTRRRSAGRSSSQHTSKRSVSAPSQTPVVAEEGGEWVAPQQQPQPQPQPQCESISERPSSVASSATINEPRQCSILLTDAQRPLPSDDVRNTTARPSNGGWARQAWKLLPIPVRPLLRLDGSKSFSIYWTDAPLSPDGTPQSIEIVRFLDESSWWQWKGQRLGRLLLQQRAIEALNLDTGLWIALALAYLDYLEERDGYHAAADG